MNINITNYKILKSLLAACDHIEGDTYQRDPLYFILTGRYGAWLIYDDISAVIVCRHPNDENCLLVFPDFMSATFSLTLSVIEHFASSLKKIQLARFSAVQLKALNKEIVMSGKQHYITISEMEEPLLDWKFPVCILDAKDAALARGKIYKGRRENANKGGRNVTAKELNFSFDMTADLKQVIKCWEVSMQNRGLFTKYTSSIYHHFFYLISDFKSEPSLCDDVNGIVYYRNKEPVGFSLWGNVNQIVDGTKVNTSNVYFNLGDGTPGFSDFEWFSICRSSLKDTLEGQKCFVNMGGSEIESLHNFKKRWAHNREGVLLERYSARIDVTRGYIEEANDRLKILEIIAEDHNEIDTFNKLASRAT